MKSIYLITLFVFIISFYNFTIGQISTVLPNNLTTKVLEYDEYVIDTGRLANCVSSTTRDVVNNDNAHTFVIGRSDHQYPSMRWLGNGYENNHYLYYGRFFVGYNNNTIRFNTSTCNDFEVSLWNYDYRTPFYVSYSMTDLPSDTANHVGIKTICIVRGWPELSRSDFLIYEYLTINNSGQLMEDVYVSLLMDCDISSIEGGSGQEAFWQDDHTGYYVGQDINGNPESISFMYDWDNWYVIGDDTGGKLIPKESSGFLGSRVLKSPITKKGIPTNQQSGHMAIFIGNDVGPGSTVYNAQAREEFGPLYNSPSDYRYFQSLGPWDVPEGDTLHVAFAFGIGIGLEKLRSILQTAYDFYQNNYIGESIPYIVSSLPSQDTLTVYQGDEVRLEIEAMDVMGKNLIYDWQIDSVFSSKRESFYIYDTKYSPLGKHFISAHVSNTRYSNKKTWVVHIKPEKKYYLFQNYPNPFNGFTNIPFELKEAGKVTINVYNVTGQKINTIFQGELAFGRHIATWDGNNSEGFPVSSGLYFYSLKTENYFTAKKLIILR